MKLMSKQSITKQGHFIITKGRDSSHKRSICTELESLETHEAKTNRIKGRNR